MKLKNKFMLGLIFSFVLFMFQSGVVFADENSLIINSSEISIEVEEYGKENFFSMIDMFLTVEEPESNPSDFKLGNPFTMVEENIEYSNVYFPVINIQDEIKYIYMVHTQKNGELTSSITAYMAEDLQQLKENSSNSPITIFTSNKDIYVEQDEELDILSEVHMQNPDDPLELARLTEKLEPIEVTDQIEIPATSNTSVNKNSRTVLSGKDYIALNWKTREVQGSNSWCGAVTLTNILANKNKPINTSAKAIIDYTYPKMSAANKKKNGVSDQHVVNFSKSKKLNPKTKNGTLTVAQVKAQIKNGNGVYMHMVGSYNKKASRHAMAITGWAQQPDKTQFYWVSNPWYNYTVMTQANTNPITVTVPGGYYTWNSTVYNF